MCAHAWKEPRLLDQNSESAQGHCQPPAAAPVCASQASISCCLGAGCGVPAPQRGPSRGVAAASLPACQPEWDRPPGKLCRRPPKLPPGGPGPPPPSRARVPEGADALQSRFLPTPGEDGAGPQHPGAPGAQPREAQHPDVDGHVSLRASRPEETFKVSRGGASAERAGRRGGSPLPMGCGGLGPAGRGGARRGGSGYARGHLPLGPAALPSHLEDVPRVSLRIRRPRAAAGSSPDH